MDDLRQAGRRKFNSAALNEREALLAQIDALHIIITHLLVHTPGHAVFLNADDVTNMARSMMGKRASLDIDVDYPVISAALIQEGRQ
jgi:hypothetical protein